MRYPVIGVNLGKVAYPLALNYQTQLFNQLLEIKAGRKAANQNGYLLFCEHPPVYTLGKHADETHLRVPSSALEPLGAQLIRTNRGGEITFHGPGQLVGYLIWDLDRCNLSLRAYIHQLEEALILTLKSYDLLAERIAGAPACG
ncbi:MAG: lipoyl(octanoyl) transferase LipB [Bacteroidia bacterium]|nr:lipoyl(octanoyl) transferase LipB [Bacteroidia bacterium]